jgi:hypothetical protein
MNTVSFSITEPPVISVNVITSNTLYCIGGSSTLTALGSGGNTAYTYTWSNGVVSPTIVVTPSATVVYTVTVSDYKNCTATNSITQNVISCAGLKDNEEESSFIISPNPSNGIYKLEVSKQEAYNLTIYNSLGQIILNEESPHFIDISGYPSGLYFLEISTSKRNSYVRKLIKQ